jgi:hypothetical protein
MARGDKNESTSWANSTDGRVHGVTSEGVTVTLSVPAGAHPLALILATSVQRAMDAAEHVGDLGQLSKDQLYYLLNDVRRFSAAAGTLEEALILANRDSGASWADLGNALDTSRSAARERYQRIEKARQVGLNTRGLADADAERAAVEDVLVISQAESDLGPCPQCRRPIMTGDEIAWLDHALTHVSCAVVALADDPMPVLRTEPAHEWDVIVTDAREGAQWRWTGAGGGRWGIYPQGSSVPTWVDLVATYGPMSLYAGEIAPPVPGGLWASKPASASDEADR